MYKFVSFAFCTGKIFKDRYKENANQRRGKAAVIEAHSAVERGNCGDDAIVQHRCRQAIAPAVFIGNGA